MPVKRVAYRPAGDFLHWSPSRLAVALGYRVELRDGRTGGLRDAFLISPAGRERETSWNNAWASLSRLARRKGVNPVLPTAEEIEAARTPHSGWTSDQLQAWGVPWPPPKGWKALLLKVYE